MKRTYFVPLCVLAGFFVLSGIACGVMSSMLAESLDKLDAMFVSRFKPPGVYHLLYHEAHDLRLQLSRQQKESAHMATSSLFLIGIITLGWAFDRRRLVRRLRAFSGRDKDPARQDV